MPLINKLENIANVGGASLSSDSNPVITEVQLPPTVVKSVDKKSAKIGEILTYTIVVTNENNSLMFGNPQFKDPLPVGCEYVENTFKLNGKSLTPTYDKATNLLSTLLTGTLRPGDTMTVIFQVKVVGGNV